jgi:hypothetical protein
VKATWNVGGATAEDEKVKATWNVGGATAEDEFDHHFKVLGIYEHTQYNTPHEADATCQTGGTGNACNADQNCTYTQVTYLGATFVNEVVQNGSGVSNNYGIVKPASICWNPCPRPGYPVPPECTGLAILRPNAENTVMGRCNQPISGTTVAVGDNNVDGLSCGDRLFIVGLGEGVGTIKIVQDRCPDCSNEPNERHLDHYNPGIHSCNVNLPTLGNMLTIQLFDN